MPEHDARRSVIIRGSVHGLALGPMTRSGRPGFWAWLLVGILSTDAGCVRFLGSILTSKDGAPVDALDQGRADRPPVDALDQGRADRPPVDALDQGRADRPPVDALDQGRADRPPESGRPDAAGTIPGQWQPLPGSTFIMGSPPTEPCREPGLSKETQHSVTLKNSFEIMTTEVTQEQFQAVLNYNPSVHKSCGPNCPVDSITWHEAAMYCNTLSARRGLTNCYHCAGNGPGVVCSVSPSYGGNMIYSCPGYRLPTEAEWEYAYRAGSQTTFYGSVADARACGDCGNAPDLEGIAWYCANAGNAPHPVGQKDANDFGLRDMAGNVNELCHDGYVVDLGSSPQTNPCGTIVEDVVIRSGSWINGADHMRAALRGNAYINERSQYTGFRAARTL